jgi:hypothetical protein
LLYRRACLFLEAGETGKATAHKATLCSLQRRATRGDLGAQDSIMSSRRNAKKASKKERRLSKAVRRGATDDMLAAGVGSLNVTNAEEDAEAMERFLDKIPPEKQREIVARQKEDDAYEKVATQQLMRAFDLARAYRYEEALPILSDVIERLHPETVDVSVERPNGGWMDCRYVSQVAIEALKARA